MSRKNKDIPDLTKKKIDIAKELKLSRSTIYGWKKTRPKLYEIIMKYYGINENTENQEK